MNQHDTNSEINGKRTLALLEIFLGEDHEINECLGILQAWEVAHVAGKEHLAQATVATVARCHHCHLAAERDAPAAVIRCAAVRLEGRGVEDFVEVHLFNVVLNTTIDRAAHGWPVVLDSILENLHVRAGPRHLPAAQNEVAARDLAHAGGAAQVGHAVAEKTCAVGQRLLKEHLLHADMLRTGKQDGESGVRSAPWGGTKERTLSWRGGCRDPDGAGS